MVSPFLRPRWLGTTFAYPFRVTSKSSTPSLFLPLHPPSSRHVATSRRTTKALRVKPWPSAVPASKRVIPAHDSIVFNPPPTAPSPYQTPPLFLPVGDPRRRLLAPSHAHDNPYRRVDPTASTDITATSDDESDLPPVLSRAPEKRYHLGATEIEEIRKLRTSNPWVWTPKRLAEKFDCSEYFVRICAQAISERMDWHKQNLERVKARWGPKRQMARENRAKRRKLWSRDD